MAIERRRTGAIVHVLLVIVAVLIVLTMRCVLTGDDAESRSPVGSASVASASGPGVGADGQVRGPRTEVLRGGAASDRTEQGAATNRRRADAAVEPSASTLTEEPAAGGESAGGRRAEPAVMYGRFALVGEIGFREKRDFGAAVAIDGDIAVVAAPGASQGSGAAFVFERTDGVWAEVQRIDSPRLECGGFASSVGVAGGRIVVFGGFATASDDFVFRSYVRGGTGGWIAEHEVSLGREAGKNVTAVLRGDTAAIVEATHEVSIWRIGPGGWVPKQRVATEIEWAPGGWVSLAGNDLAVGVHKLYAGGSAASFFSARGGTFEEEPSVKLSADSMRASAALARDGAALVSMDLRLGLSVLERRDERWVRTVTSRTGWGDVDATSRTQSVAADGDLVVVTSRDWTEFTVLERRADGWYRTTVVPQSPPGEPFPKNCWSGERLPAVAINGRTVVVGFDWRGYGGGMGGGRAWLFDITDDDLARATKVESDAK